jgi:hypothetical protein
MEGTRAARSMRALLFTLGFAAMPALVWAQSTVTVPSGTILELELTQGVNSDHAKRGDRVEARLRHDVMVGNWRALESGARATGSITEVESGGDQIGGRPVVELTFDTITAPNGATVPINARYKQKGDSETGEDAAKIAGGAAAGAVLGNQVDEDQGAVVGGVVGAAAGAAAAKNTGDDVKLKGGKVIQARVEADFRVPRPR